jgi:hypothetical protein
MILSGCTIDRNHNYISVKHYGIHGDGVHDDWNAIQSLVNQGGNIYFPKGIYLVSNTIHITRDHTHLRLNKNAIIECNSTTFAIDSLGNGGATISFNPTRDITDRGGYINDIGIEGGHVRNTSPKNSLNPNNENAIGFSHCNDFYCRNVIVDYCNRKGITVQNSNLNGVIENCFVYNCGLHGITIETQSNNINLKNNTICLSSNSYAIGENTNNGLHFGIHVTHCNSIYINNNKLFVEGSYGLYLHSVDSLEITHNRIELSNVNPLHCGIFTDASKFINVAHNEVESEGRGIVLASLGQNYVSDFVKDNTIISNFNSLELTGDGKISTFEISSNEMKIRDCVVSLYYNSAKSCNIQRPFKTCKLYYNKLNSLNVMNASDSTRAISIGNVYKTSYENWEPQLYNDTINGSKCSNM